MDEFTNAIKIAKRLRMEGIKARVMPSCGDIPLSIILDIETAQELASRLESITQASLETRLEIYPNQID